MNDNKLFSASEYIIYIWQQASLSLNDRVTILCQSDQMSAVRLCLAEAHKQVNL